MPKVILQHGIRVRKCWVQEKISFPYINNVAIPIIRHINNHIMSPFQYIKIILLENTIKMKGPSIL